MGSNLSHSTLSQLSAVFNILDQVVQEHDAFKVETIGSEYMAVSGLPASARHPANTSVTMINVAIGMLDAIHSHPAMQNVTLQIGINSGTAVETILGRELLPRWKLFGDTVNTASRMKSFGGPGRIHISERVRQQAMRPIVAAWKRIDPGAAKQWQSLNKHPKRFMDGTGTGSPVQLRPIELTKLDDSVAEFLGFSIDPVDPHEVKGKGMMHTHFINVRFPAKLLRLPQQPGSVLLKQIGPSGISQPDGKWLMKPGPVVLDDAAMSTSIRALMVDELQRLVLTVDHTSARNLTMIGNGQNGMGKPPPIVQSSRSSQVLPSVSQIADIEEPDQKHKAALVGLRFMRMLSLADSKTVRSSASVDEKVHKNATGEGSATQVTGSHPLQYTASSMSMRDTDTLIGRRPTLNMQNSSASFVVPVTDDTELDSVIGGDKHLISQRTIHVGDTKDTTGAMPRVKSFSLQRARHTAHLARSSSARTQKHNIQKSFRNLINDGTLTAKPGTPKPKPPMSPTLGQSPKALSGQNTEEQLGALDEASLHLYSVDTSDPSYDILAGDLHKRIRATPEEMSNAIPMPILNERTLCFEKASAKELERLFLHYLSGSPSHYLRGCMALLACTTAFIFVHVASMLQTTFGIVALALVCVIAAGFACSSLLVYSGVLPCPLFKIMPYIRAKLQGTSLIHLQDGEIAAIIAQHFYGFLILLFTAVHYIVMVHNTFACRDGACGAESTGAAQGHAAYHHAAFHHIVLMILSETLRFRFVQLTTATAGLLVVAVVALAVGDNSDNVWAIGWILLNSCVALLLSRSNERRRRSDFFLGYVSDEGSRETLNMLYAMLPQAIAKPLLDSVSLDNSAFPANTILDDDFSFKCCTPSGFEPEDLMNMRIPRPLGEDAVVDVEAHSSLYEPSTQLVSLLMFDLVGFTKLSAAIGPHKLVTMLDKLYASFDRIVRKRQAYKVETIGDAFLVSCGAPEVMAPEQSAVTVCKCAVEMLRRVRSFTAPGGHILQARIGVHVGRVMAGVISSHMPRYQLFGTEVDNVMLMESSGQPGRVHASQSILQHIATAPDLQVVETLPDGTGFVDRDRSAATFAPW